MMNFFSNKNRFHEHLNKKVSATTLVVSTNRTLTPRCTRIHKITTFDVTVKRELRSVRHSTATR